MASIIDATNAVRPLLGKDYRVTFDEEHDPEVLEKSGGQNRVLFRLRAVGHSHPPQNPHKRLKSIEGEWVNAGDHVGGSRELLEVIALDNLCAAAARVAEEAEIARARELVARNPEPKAPEVTPEPAPEDPPPPAA